MRFTSEFHSQFPSRVDTYVAMETIPVVPRHFESLEFPRKDSIQIALGGKMGIFSPFSVFLV